jgi:hypothetical protein
VIFKDNQQHLDELEISLDIEIEILEKKKKERDEIMKALHQYNEIKDATQEVLGRLAIIEGVTVAEMHRKYNLLESD